MFSTRIQAQKRDLKEDVWAILVFAQYASSPKEGFERVKLHQVHPPI